MTPPEPLPIELLYDETTLRRLGVEPEPTRAELSMAQGLELEYEFDHDRHVEGYLGEARYAGDDEPAPAPDGGSPTMRSRVGKPLSGLMLAAAMSGVGEVLEPESRKPTMVEFDPGHDHFRDRPVEFVYVPGSPRLSRIVLRPWLRAG